MHHIDKVDQLDLNLWQDSVRQGIQLFLAPYEALIGPEHIRDTPDRVVRALSEYFWGAHVDPRSVLSTGFTEQAYDEMVVVKEMDFVSFCCHHILPFYGKVHFAYIPNGRVVGLSKIPRLIEILSARPQIQERLAHDVVSVFEEVIQPRGCAVVLEALHTCMCVRGVKKYAMTRTTALRGEFMKDHVKQEFFSSIGTK